MQDGEHDEGMTIPCVRPHCPEAKEFTLELRLMTPEEIEAFYASGKTIF